jgi:hypothetical protein
MQSKVYVVAEEHVTIRGAKKVHKFIRTHSENKGKTSLICIEFAKNRKYIRAAQKLDKNSIKSFGKTYGRYFEPHFTELIRGFASLQNASVVPIDMSAAKTPQHEKFVKEMKTAFVYFERLRKITFRSNDEKKNSVALLGDLFLEQDRLDEQLYLCSKHIIHVFRGYRLREKVMVDNIIKEIKRVGNDGFVNIFVIAGASHTYPLYVLLTSKGYRAHREYLDSKWAEHLQNVILEAKVSANEYLKGNRSESNKMRIIRLMLDQYEFPNTKKLKSIDKFVEWGEEIKYSGDWQLIKTIEDARRYHAFITESMQPLAE